MPVHIQDPQSAAALSAAVHPMNVFGPDGQLLGQFWPVVPGMSFPEFGITDKEIERRLNDPNAKWYTHEEVMARLHSLRDAPTRQFFRYGH
jgi:hypothetical protein